MLILLFTYKYKAYLMVSFEALSIRASKPLLRDSCGVLLTLLHQPLLMGSRVSNLLLFHTKLHSVPFSGSDSGGNRQTAPHRCRTTFHPIGSGSCSPVSETRVAGTCRSGVSRSRPMFTSLTINHAGHLRTLEDLPFLFRVLSV